MQSLSKPSPGAITCLGLLAVLSACAPAPVAPLPAPLLPASAAAQAPSPTSTSAPTPDPFPDPTLKIVGNEEVVFNWQTSHCEALNIPDIATRAFRDATGQVQLILSHYVPYRMLGPDLNHLKVSCKPLLSSQHKADPALYNDTEWIAAPYTEDGKTVYAIVHDEYHGREHPGRCPQNDQNLCWYNVLTLAVSKDGGASYQQVAPAPDHLVASLPFQYQAGNGPYGIMNPTNIVKGKDGYYYSLVRSTDFNAKHQWACLMRTQDLSDPKSWRYWDGAGYNGVFPNPYVDQISDPNKDQCTAISPDDIAGVMTDSLTYSTYLDRYVLMGVSADSPAGREQWGFYYSFSSDLIHWTHRRLLVEMPLSWTVKSPADVHYLYPSLLDPESISRNFETTGKTAYLYYTRVNGKGPDDLDRDLIRVPVEFFPDQQWDFNTDGSADGWAPFNQLSPFQVSGGHLNTHSLGPDPYMVSSVLSLDAAASPKLEIHMKVSAGNQGQVFFATEASPQYDESRSVHFELQADGEFHTYMLDMSQASGWKGLVTQIRLDPTDQPGDVEVDYIHILAP